MNRIGLRANDVREKIGRKEEVFVIVWPRFSEQITVGLHWFLT